ncbi:hypothetical protein [Lysobacter sp. Root690]|uniref:hypothetical protein n=1 Tax=Lysobacter sp. Root690 TaxID=1736588 RepID=UPI0012FBF534|nr:hypothetical protein [Lysobacter sp. Root690]
MSAASGGRTDVRDMPTARGCDRLDEDPVGRSHRTPVGATHRQRIAHALDDACALARIAKNSGDFHRDGLACGGRRTIAAALHATSSRMPRTADAVQPIPTARSRRASIRQCTIAAFRRAGLVKDDAACRADAPPRDLSRRHFRVALAATRTLSARRLGTTTRARGSVRGGRLGERASPLSSLAGVFADR